MVDDPLFRVIGNFGRFQARICVIMAFSCFNAVWQAMANKFLTEGEDFKCIKPDYALNVTMDQCGYNIGNETVLCQEWSYHGKDFMVKTIFIEFGSCL